MMKNLRKLKNYKPRNAWNRLAQIWKIEASGGDIWVSEAQTRREGGTLAVSAQLVSVSGAPLLVERSGVRITVLGSRHAVDVQGCEAP